MTYAVMDPADEMTTDAISNMSAIAAAVTRPWRNESSYFDPNSVSDDFFSFVNSMEDENRGNCMKSFLDMGQSYKEVHGYVALVICVFGTVANILNLIVLKEMSSPINRMLTALAFADMLVMLEYIPFAIHMYIIPTPNFSYPWALFVLFHSHFTQVFHTISIQLTLTMAVWRYIAIRCSNRSSTFCTFKRCNMCILASYTCPFLLCMPNYFTFAIYHNQSYSLDLDLPMVKNKFGPDRNSFQAFCDVMIYIENCGNHIIQNDFYVVDLSDMAKAHNGILQWINFWTFSVFIKLIPCVVLTVFMCWLLNTLYKAKRRHKMLQENSNLRMKPMTPTVNPEHSQNQALLLVNKNGVQDKDTTTTCNGNGNKLTTEMILEDQPSNIPSVVVGGDGPSGKHKVGFHAFPALLNRQSQKTKSSKRSDRTSKMLIAVLCLFLLTEFPQGIMAFLSGIYGQEFFRYCYNTWAEVWDTLALFNSAVNFVLYCFMSRQFRLQFQQLFKLHSPKWMTNCNTMVSTTV